MLAWLERNLFIVMASAGLLILLLGSLILPALGDDRGPPALVFRDGAGTTPGVPIRVHVVGAVEAPGVYELAGGDRVEDAIALAGGATGGADLVAINLARRLRDGEQILVPGTPPAGEPLVEGEPLDINAATRDQLMALPGIGEAYSRRIVDSRLADGPFQSVEELLVRNVVPQRTLEGIRDLITVALP